MTDFCVSFTTIPSRIDNIKKTINSINNQTLKPSKIFLNLPDKYKRFNNYEFTTKQLLTLEKLNIEINRCEDYGPSTKLMGSLKKIKDFECVIILDDDHIYQKEIFEIFIDKYKKKKGNYSYYVQKVFKLNMGQGADCILIETKDLGKIENFYQSHVKNNINLFFGRGRHFVTYPTGNNGMINFVFCKREKGQMINSWKKKVTTQKFLNDFELNEKLKICLPDVQEIYRWPIIESEIPTTLHKKNVVMVGDAAKSMLPYMAQGANKALEDSWELASCIKDFPLNIDEALKNYSKKRIKRLHQLDQVSRLNEKVYHLEQRVLRKIFFGFLRCLTRLSPSLFFRRLDWIYNYKG